MIDKGPPKPTRDVPAKTALARISNIVNPIIQAYDKLALTSSATVLSTGVGPKIVVDRAEAAVQIGKANDGIAAGAQATVGKTQEGIVALGNGASSGAKAVNVETKLPHGLAENKQKSVEEHVLQIEGGKQIVNVNNDTVVNRAGDVPASAVQNQSSGKINDRDNAGQFRDRVVSITDGAVDNIEASHATSPVVHIEEALKLDKGPSKPSRDVPASTFFAIMYLATAGALKAAGDPANINSQDGKEIMDRAVDDRVVVGQDKVGTGL
ncbi:hypothetical protein A4A49_02951 [Nicotiana attenuata]|uniref:Uncharacterized protein n=1 Tax=Nicotiana attenuata TaxID=49451 RepID=A0A1J6ITB2_NICAT|nr:hypothetical protein A4A49_02951 [Nicotiana attenuata]